MSSRSGEKSHPAIQAAKDVNALRTIRETEQQRLSEALAAEPFLTVAESLGALHEALVSRTLELAEQEMARLGFTAPPVPYAYMLFGSGGRGEMTFSSDQDSGIVYGNPASDEEAASCEAYFARFASEAVQMLIALGYPPCEGNVIASNPQWCLSLRQWEEKVDGWFADPSWENVRYLLIVADGRTIAGDERLSDGLIERFGTDMLQNPVIVRRMMENTLRHKVLVGIFGQLLRERYGENAGGLDIKYGAYIPMVNVFRLLALQAGIRAAGTLGRIDALRSAGKISEREAEEAVSAFTLVMKLRLLTAARVEGTKWIGSGKVPKEQLTKELAQSLKKALKFGKRMQRRVERDMQDRFGGR